MSNLEPMRPIELVIMLLVSVLLGLGMVYR